MTSGPRDSDRLPCLVRLALTLRDQQGLERAFITTGVAADEQGMPRCPDKRLGEPAARAARSGLSPTFRRFRRERGVALVLTLFIVALVSVLVLEYHFEAAVELDLAHNYGSDVQAYHVALSGMRLAQELLAYDDSEAGRPAGRMAPYRARSGLHAAAGVPGSWRWAGAVGAAARRRCGGTGGPAGCNGRGGESTGAASA